MKLRQTVRHLLNIFTVRNFLAAKLTALVLFVLGLSPISGFAQAPCSIVKVLSGKQINQHKFTQQGVGWVYSWAPGTSEFEKNNELNVLLPAHVIFEANKVFAECNDEMAELFVKGTSSSYDLAVLGFLKPDVIKKFKPLFRIKKNKNSDFDLTDLNKDIFVGHQLMNLTAAHFKGSQLIFTTLGIKNNDLKNEFNYQFPQYRKSILNSAGAIRPGMSGSPLFNGANTFPIGMNLKTKVNDHISLVLPTEEILPLLPELEKGRDPWKREHPNYDISFFHHFDPSQKILQRFRQLVIRDNQGKVIERYTEPCHFGSMVESTKWSEIEHNLVISKKMSFEDENKNKFSWSQYFQNKAAEKIKNSDKNWGQDEGSKILIGGGGGGGGSWGDSGGGLNGKTSSATLYTEDNNNSSNGKSNNGGDWILKKLMFGGDAQYFLSKDVCPMEGLPVEDFQKKPENKILLASKLQLKKGPSVTVKANDLESLLLVLLGEEKLNGAGNFEKSISSNRIYKGDKAASLRLICNKDLLGKNLKVFGSHVDASEKETLLPSRPWNDFDVKRMFENKTTSHMLLVREKKYLSKMKENPVVYLQCEGDGDSLEIVSENSDWSYRFTIKNGILSGHFSISNIDKIYEIKGEGTEDKHLFKYLAEDPEQGFKIQVILDPLNDPLVTIRFIDIPEEEKLKYSFSFNNTIPSLEFMESLWYVRD